MAETLRDPADYLGLVPTGEGIWRFVVTPGMANPLGTLYGGAPIAASVVAAEAAIGAPVRWATTRFLSGAPVDTDIDIAVRVDVAGRRTSHVTVTGTLASDPGASLASRVFETILVTGGDSSAMTERGTWPEMPDVPLPADLPVPPPRTDMPDFVRQSAVGTMERRVAVGSWPGDGDAVLDGRIAMWFRAPGLGATNRPALAWLGDCVPMSIGAALGAFTGGSSLDNTIRFAQEPTTPDDGEAWILADISAGSLAGGYGYGQAHLWAEDGTLLATASQTALVRPPSFAFPGHAGPS